MSARKFKVMHKFVGPYAEGSVFSEPDFRARHPAPGYVDDKDVYYGESIDRLLNLGAVIEVPESTATDDVPVGPENKTLPPTVKVASKDDVLGASGGKTDAEPRKPEVRK